MYATRDDDLSVFYLKRLVEKRLLISNPRNTSGRCYENSAIAYSFLASDYPELAYCEGYSYYHDWIEHGFLYDRKKGSVVEIEWLLRFDTDPTHNNYWISLMIDPPTLRNQLVPILGIDVNFKKQYLEHVKVGHNFWKESSHNV